MPTTHVTLERAHRYDLPRTVHLEGDVSRPRGGREVRRVPNHFIERGSGDRRSEMVISGRLWLIEDLFHL